MPQLGDTLRFGVCTVTHGERLELLRENVESIAQWSELGLVEVEQVVVDNGSVDGTAEYLRQATEDYPHLKAVYLPKPVPLGEARNMAFLAVTRDRFYDQPEIDYVVPLDSDDYLLPHGLQALSAIAEDFNSEMLRLGDGIHPNYPERQWQCSPGYLPEVVFGIPLIVDHEGRITTHPTLDFFNFDYSYQAADFMESLYREDRIAVGTLAATPQAVRRAGGWDPRPYLTTPEWGFWLNLIATAESFYWDRTRYISTYRLHDDQTSQVPGMEQAWDVDGYYIRRRLLERHLGAESMRFIAERGDRLFTDEYLGPGADDFVRFLCNER